MRYTIENPYLRVTADTKGAELISVFHKKSGTEALWQGDPKYWSDRSPNLFPFVARLKDAKYTYEGKTYSLPLHGFLMRSETKYLGGADNRIVFELTDTEDTLMQYPFRFRLTVEYALQEQTLFITYTLHNPDAEKELVFGLGGHPGFFIPFAEGTGFTDYYLEFAQPCKPVRVLFDGAILRTGETVPYPLTDNQRLYLRHELFDHDAIVLQGAGHSVTIGTDKSSRFIRVAYPGMEQVGFWQAQNTDAPYVCVEPWVTLPGRADAITDFSSTTEMMRLAPGGTYQNTFTAEIGF